MQELLTQHLSPPATPAPPGNGKAKPLIRFEQLERCALFIDGLSLYATARNLGFDVDYRTLLEYFQSSTSLVRAYFYCAVTETEEYSPLRPLTDWLVYNGFSVVTKAAREYTDATGRRRVKGNMDIELAVDMMELAPRLDHAVLFSGDGNLRRLVETVQRRGVRVTVVSSLRAQATSVADDLRRQADEFVELADLAPTISRQKDRGQTTA